MPNPIELCRRDQLLEVDQSDWHMALLIFKEMGWRPKRPVQAYANPLTFITPDEGGAMQRAGKSLFSLALEDPSISASIQMDLGLFYDITEFVGGGAFAVGRPGAHADAKEHDF